MDFAAKSDPISRQRALSSQHSIAAAFTRRSPDKRAATVNIKLIHHQSPRHI
jgi:hypothetical protein